MSQGMNKMYKCPNCGSTGPFQRTQEKTIARWYTIDGNGVPQNQESKEEEEKDELLCEACDFESDIYEFECHVDK